MKQPQIKLHIAFSGIFLEIISCEDNHDRVPLKDIAEAIGINWRSATRKLAPGKYLNERLGIKMMPTSGHKKEVMCIRLDRVTSFLNTLNPEMIASKGNLDTAKWLKDKHQEWDDALHSYETYGVAAKKTSNTDRMLNHLAKLDNIKTASTREVYADTLNKEYGLNLPVTGKLDL